MHRRSGWGAAAFALAALGGCVTSEPPVQVATEEQEVVGVPPCQEEICGSNSPVIDVIGFHELSLWGQVNREGFAIVTGPSGASQIVKGTRWYDLHVVGGMISGTKIGFPDLKGVDLRNAWIPIKNTVTGKPYSLVIQDVSPMSFFVPLAPSPSAPPPVPPPTVPAPSFEAYTLAWRDGFGGDDNARRLCNNVDGMAKYVASRRGQDGPDPELMGLDVLQSVVYEGDRVDSRRKLMSKSADDRWFNIGCAGHTLAKLWLTRNTVHSQRAGLTRAWEQRQATLKMLVADVCGTGDAFTVWGQKLVWQGDLMSYFSWPGGLEGRWSPDGALCLSEPRMLTPTTAAGAAMFPDIWTQIGKVCSPPKCANLDPFVFAGADRVSSNP